MSDSELLSEPLVALGESCQRSLRLSRDDITDFARLTGDSKPLHHDTQAAQRARHGETIASAQHITALLLGLASSYFSRAGDGFVRDLLCLNFNFAFKSPVLAEQQLELTWRVVSVERHAGLGGQLVQVDGVVAVRHATLCVVGRGTLLVKALLA